MCCATSSRYSQYHGLYVRMQKCTYHLPWDLSLSQIPVPHCQMCQTFCGEDMIFGNDVMIPKEIFKFEWFEGPSKKKKSLGSFK